MDNKPSPPLSAATSGFGLILSITASAFLVGGLSGWLARGVFVSDQSLQENPSLVGGDTIQAETPGQKLTLLPSAPSPSAPSSAAPDTPPAQTQTDAAKSLLSQLVSELDASGQPDPMKMMGRIQQLKDMGPDGSKAIADYLSTYEDLVFQGGGPGGGRWGGGGSLRLALLDALYDMGDPASLQASLQTLQNSPSLAETVAAARNLDRWQPGQNDTLARQRVSGLLQQLAQKNAAPGAEPNPETFSDYRAAMGYISSKQATDLLPLVEQSLSAFPRGAVPYLFQLSGMGGAVQSAALARLSQNPQIATQIAQSGRALAGLDYGNPQTRSTVADLFNKQMPAREKEDFIERLGEGRGGGGWRGGGGGCAPPGMGGPPPGGGGFGRPPEESSLPPAERITRAQGSLQLLDQLQTQMNTPVLQQRASESRAALLRRIEQARATPAP